MQWHHCASGKYREKANWGLLKRYKKQNLEPRICYKAEAVSLNKLQKVELIRRQTRLLRHTPTYSDPLLWSLVLMVHVLNSCSGLPTSGNKENLYNSPRAFGGDKPSYQTVSNIHMLMRHLKNLNNKVLKPWGISIESQCRVDTSCGPKLVGIGCRINENHCFWSGGCGPSFFMVLHFSAVFIDLIDFGSLHRFFPWCSSISPWFSSWFDFPWISSICPWRSSVFPCCSSISPCCLLICPLVSLLFPLFSSIVPCCSSCLPWVLHRAFLWCSSMFAWCLSFFPCCLSIFWMVFMDFLILDGPYRFSHRFHWFFRVFHCFSMCYNIMHIISYNCI